MATSLNTSKGQTGNLEDDLEKIGKKTPGNPINLPFLVPSWGTV